MSALHQYMLSTHLAHIVFSRLRPANQCLGFLDGEPVLRCQVYIRMLSTAHDCTAALQTCTLVLDMNRVLHSRNSISCVCTAQIFSDRTAPKLMCGKAELCAESGQQA